MFSSEIVALLGKGSSFDGRLVFEGVVRIDGEFRGQIFTRDTLIVGPDAKLHADIEADTVIVGGTVEGKIKASGRVEIQPGGFLKGAVISPVLKIEEGGLFDGTTHMLPSDAQVF